MIFTPRARRIAVASIALLFPLQSLAAIRTWDAGGADNDWSTAENWSDDTVPGAGDIALFDGTGQTDAYVNTSFGGTVASIQVTESFTGSVILRRHLNVENNVLLSGGTLDMSGSGYRLVVKKNWVNDGATFEAGTGTVLLAGTGSHTLKEDNAFHHLYVNDGLVGYWTLDDGSSASFIRDASGYGNNGIASNISNEAWLSSEKPSLNYADAYALDFSLANNDAITVPNGSLAILEPPTVTAMAWSRFPDGTSGRVFVSGNWGRYSIYVSSDNTYRAEARFGTNEYLTAPSSTPDVWHHTAVIIGPEAYQLYVDGVLAAEGEGDDIVYSGFNQSFMIGDYTTLGSASFDGQIDDVRIYNRALSAAEIARLAGGSQPQTSLGTYTLASNLDVNGSLTLAAGTLDVSSSNYTITVSGSWLNYGGVLNARDGSVSFDGSSNNLQGGSESFATLNIDEDTTINGITTVTDDLSIDVSKTLALSFDLTASAITNNGLIVENDGGIIHASTLSVSPPAFIIGDSLFVTVRDSDANVNGTAQDTITATVNGQSLTLTETTATSGIFQGSLPMNGNLTVCSSVSIVYADPQDSSDVRSATSLVIDGNGRCGSGDGGSGGGGGGGGRRTSPTSLSSSSAPTTSAPSATSVPSATSRFSDTPPSAWFTPSIEALTTRGIISGYTDAQGNLTGTFGPNDPVTVGQILKIALLSAGHELPSPPSVPRNATAINDWSAPYVALGESLSLALSSEDVLRPATRGEVVTALLEAFGITLEAGENPFTDLPRNHSHSKAIVTAYELGLVTGDTDADGNFLFTIRPDDEINRAEVAALVMRLLER